MPPRTPDEIFDAFVADGNKVIGPRPKKIIGAFDMSWRGGGSVVEFGDDVIFSITKLFFTNGGGTIRIENGVVIRGRLEANGGGMVRIGEGTLLNRACDIRGGEGAVADIGKNCLFSNVKVMTSDMHSVLDLETGNRTNPAAGIVIEDHVWVAEDVKIAKGVRVGQGSIVAAGSLVTRSIAPFSLAVGRPARVLRTGVRWSRSLVSMPPMPAPTFSPEDIPLEKETIRLLIQREEYALVEAVISKAENNTPLPLFARWYLVLTRHKLGRPHPEARAMLDAILAEAPRHTAARTLRDRLNKSGS